MSFRRLDDDEEENNQPVSTRPVAPPRTVPLTSFSRPNKVDVMPKSEMKNLLIDQLQSGLDNLLQKANAIGTEIDGQNSMLQRQNEQVSATNEDVAEVHGRLKALLDQAGTCFWPYGVLIFLTVLCVMWFVLLIYT
jgi:hypothetical protein